MWARHIRAQFASLFDTAIVCRDFFAAAIVVRRKDFFVSRTPTIIRWSDNLD